MADDKFWSDTNIIKDSNYAFLFLKEYIIHECSLSSNSHIWLVHFKDIILVPASAPRMV